MQSPINDDKTVDTKYLVLLILLAYAFSFLIRMIWIWQFQDNPSFYWNGQLMINTNDGYFFAAGAQQALWDMHQSNPRIPDMSGFGLVFFTTLFAQITPFSFETIILYMPAVISSLVVIPIILTARLFNQTLWGFFAALLGAVTVSYYNRTMVGYYDTDMFSAMAPMFILFFLMKSTIDFDLKSALYAALAISVYPFLYDQGLSVVYAMGMMYALYMIFYHRNENTTYLSLILVFVSLLPFPLAAPFNYMVKIAVVAGLYLVVQRVSVEQKKLMLITGVLFVLFLVFGNVFGIILSKVVNYLSTGTKTEGLHFYSVVQTIREAGQIPFPVFAQRISGSQLGLVLALIGYIVLVLRHRVFILALPLVGIGMFALFGGLRFTVYAVPMAAMSAVYLFFAIGDFFKDKKLRYGFAALATAAMLYPNIAHIVDYKVPTVLNKAEVEDLVKLDAIADTNDYTLAWWDYGYPIWFYSDTNTLIDGGKHQNDNFIISKILQTASPDLAANLSRLAVETYVSSGYAETADTLFKNKQKDQLDPNVLLAELEDPAYTLPVKTREIYLYLPYRMMSIFPTVMLFGNLDLTTGKPEREVVFYPTRAVKNDNGKVIFANGIQFDAQKGELLFGADKKEVKQFIVTQNTNEGEIKLQSQHYHADAEHVVIYMQSYGQFLVLDSQTFESAYVQMFILGKYDANLFEPVVSSPYSRIYKLKK
jgi:dolichyl-diphosphooligosaccharide--protein glycosyltransferase/undecaprenyl-diphosphooligosaccharide--protein glycosyltransferase